jgi:hypothetical protein
LKGYLAGRTFESVKAMHKFVKGFLRNIPPETLRSTFEDWMKRCVAVQQDGSKFIKKMTPPKIRRV